MDKRHFWYSVVYHLAYPIYYLTHPFKMVGLENVPDGSVVIAGNHSDMADSVVTCLGLGMGRQVRPMAKKELRKIPIIGWMLEQAGAIFVDRGNADLKAVKTAMKHLKEGGRLLVFPEGTRVKEGETVEAKGGAALMAARTGSPLLPVYIPREKPWFRTTTVVFGEPFYPQFEGRKPTAQELDATTEELMRRIRALKEGA